MLLQHSACGRKGCILLKSQPDRVLARDSSIVVVDEYWYAEDIRLNLLEKHNDPRKGDFTTTVTQVTRAEPAGELFVVPTGYKVVDVAPEN